MAQQQSQSTSLLNDHRLVYFPITTCTTKTPTMNTPARQSIPSTTTTTLQVLLKCFLLLNLLGGLTVTQSQSIIYSITRLNSSPERLVDSTNLPTITTTTTSSTLRQGGGNGPQNETSVTEGGYPTIKERSKRFISKMPRVPTNMQVTNFTQTQTTNLKESSKNISLVLADLLDDYDYNQRPGYGGPPAVITTNLEIRSMGPISELDMEYSLDCYFRQKWQDERLRYTGSANYLSLNIKMLDKIWKPDTYFHTGKGSHLHMITTANKFLRVYPDYLLYSMRLTIKSLCPMDLHSFPMDRQSCPLILGSYGYPNDQLVYSWDVIPVTFNDRTLSQFDIVGNPTRNGTYSFRRGNHSMLQVNFNLRRHVGYFLIQIYVPCSLIVVLSWVSFWINREATADRVGLGVTSVLTLSTFGLDSRSDLPRVSYATALDWYTIMCFLFVVSTLLQFAAVHYFTKVGTGEVPFVEIDNCNSSSDEDDSFNSDEDDEDSFDRRNKHQTRRSQAQHRWQSAANRLRHRNRLSKRIQPIHSKRLRGKVKFGPNHMSRSVQPIVEYEMHYRQNANKSRTQQDYKLSVIGNHVPTGTKPDRVHMPYCPKSHEYQQYLRCRGADNNNLGEPYDNGNSYLENYVSKRLQSNARMNAIYPKADYNAALAYGPYGPQPGNSLKQTASWPTLVWSEMLEEHDDANLPWSMTDLTEGGSTFEDGANDGHFEAEDVEEGNEKHPNRVVNFWKAVIFSVSLCLVQFWYCFSANEKYKAEMKRRRPHGWSAVNSVSKIDKVSRVLFPLIFFGLNVIYWSFYIHERSIEINQGEMANVNLN